eukprot:5472412-Pyramimonas_sp.AAC.1
MFQDGADAAMVFCSQAVCPAPCHSMSSAGVASFSPVRPKVQFLRPPRADPRAHLASLCEGGVPVLRATEISGPCCKAACPWRLLCSIPRSTLGSCCVREPVLALLSNAGGAWRLASAHQAAKDAHTSL